LIERRNIRKLSINLREGPFRRKYLWIEKKSIIKSRLQAACKDRVRERISSHSLASVNRGSLKHRMKPEIKSPLKVT
jgi:hypothetical protein